MSEKIDEDVNEMNGNNIDVESSDDIDGEAIGDNDAIVCAHNSDRDSDEQLSPVSDHSDHQMGDTRAENDGQLSETSEQVIEANDKTGDTECHSKPTMTDSDANHDSTVVTDMADTADIADSSTETITSDDTKEIESSVCALIVSVVNKELAESMNSNDNNDSNDCNDYNDCNDNNDQQISEEVSQTNCDINNDVNNDSITGADHCKQTDGENVTNEDNVEIKTEETLVIASEANQTKAEDELSQSNSDFEDEYIDAEGGQEGIDDDDNYEDIEESEECSASDVEDNETNDSKAENEQFSNKDEGIECADEPLEDGEENSDQQQQLARDKALDHDEDKRNPQYIPKRGPFYEHDDRMTGEELAAKEEVFAVKDETPLKQPIIIAKKPVEVDTTKKPRKKLWNESDRWGHDMFNEDEQAPKSKDELVNIYGYDIRNEDDPPKARRQKRYGRGPNKYTRQWQDENAYGKPTPIIDSRTRTRRNDDNDADLKHTNRDRIERIDRSERVDRSDRERLERVERNDREERANEANAKRFAPIDKTGIEKKRMDYEEKIARRSQPFSNDDFPELPTSDIKKKSAANSQDMWKKSSPRYHSAHVPNLISNECDDKIEEYKTEPMKIIEAIENSNRSYNENNLQNIVRTQTFENSKFSQRRSSGGGFDYDEEEKKGRGRSGSRVNNEIAGRAIRKTNSLTYTHNRETPTDNYRNRNNGRQERHFVDDSHRNIERFYENETFTNQTPVSSFISESTAGMHKLSIEDKSIINRNNDSEQPRPKRYSSLRQQQRVMPENMANMSTNSQIAQHADGRTISGHQYYDAHQMPTAVQPTVQPSVPTGHQPGHASAFYAESTPRTAYHPYMSPNASETPPQTIASNYLPQQLTQRYISSAAPPPAESARYLPTIQSMPSVSTGVVTANVSPTIQPIPSIQPIQSLPSMPTAGPPPPPQVLPAPPPPGPQYIPTFPSGYPAFPPPATHVPPGYPPQVVAQATAHQLAELYRGGVTYYDTQSQQQHTVRQVPQRRPKAAIPIVPPPDPHSGDGDTDKSYVTVNS